MSNGDKLQQIRCRLLSPFINPAHLHLPGLYNRRGLVSRRKTFFLMVRINAVSWLA
jgi:hypothetical protein